MKEALSVTRASFFVRLNSKTADNRTAGVQKRSARAHE